VSQERLSLGAWGEEAAAVFLRRKGMKILARNLRTPVGEVDLIARHAKDLVFIEVKTRRTAAFGPPQEAVGPRKQRQIIRAAQWYLGDGKGGGLQPRFDVVAVYARGERALIEHFPNAFEL